MRVHAFLLAAALSLPTGGCGTSSEPSVRRRIPVTYNHTFEFMWEQVLLELRETWDLDEILEKERTITTGWVERLSPMGHQGRRHRIRVFVTGSDGRGYEVDAEQDTEENTNDQSPLSSNDAEWSGTDSDGAQADRFLIGLARRLHPDMEWKREMIR